jgi:hypothetical protein
VDRTAPQSRTTTWALALIALLGSAGSLALSLALDLRACPLCFYQRAFAMMAFASLVLAATARGDDGHLLGTRVAATAVLAGLVVAGFHVQLELTGALECPGGLLAAAEPRLLPAARRLPGDQAPRPGGIGPRARPAARRPRRRREPGGEPSASSDADEGVRGAPGDLPPALPGAVSATSSERPRPRWISRSRHGR